MIQQFNAKYRVTVFSNKETTIVEYPITCKFTVTRGVFSDSNRATIQLYNLGLSTRNQIFQDQFTLDQSKFKYVHLEAGYNDNFSLIFKGRILQAYSFKSGQTDIITEIQATALDIFDRQTSHTFEVGTTFKEAHNRMAADMPNVIVGNIGNLNGEFKTPTTFDGMALEQLNTLTGGHTFVDNGVLNTIMDNEVIDVAAPIISSQTNLLETPMRKDANLEIKTLFLPDIIVGQLVEVDSEISPNFNGQFKLVGFTHDCLISPTQAGTRTTRMTLWIGPLLPSSNLNLAVGNQNTPFSKVKGEDITPVAINEPSDVRGVYNYIKNNNGNIPNKKITRNISWKEMIGNDNTNSERLQELSIAILSNVYTVAHAFQQVIDRYFPGRKVKINSGWRSVNNNSRWKGNPKSKHLDGLAIDFRIAEIPTNQVVNIFKSVWNGKILYYEKGNFIHIQQSATKGYINDV